MNVYSLLAALVVLGHILFVVVAAFGSLAVLRWPRFTWVQLPAAIWAAYVEFAGRLCPLTPLENALRQRAGLDRYTGDFVARYIFPVLYPEGLTRDAQLAIGWLVVALNVAVYGWLAYKWTRAARPASGGP